MAFFKRQICAVAGSSDALGAYMADLTCEGAASTHDSGIAARKGAQISRECVQLLQGGFCRLRQGTSGD